jgi:nucleotide-binding universal stress UspA family protein
MSIVVGYIPTPEGRAALKVAASEAELRSLPLLVITSHEGGGGYRGEDELRVRRELERVQAHLDAVGIKHETHSYIRGNDPAEDLVAAAKDFDASLIVIGLRRRSPIGKFILGSNAQAILMDAPCPVLSVHAEDAQDA